MNFLVPRFYDFIDIILVAFILYRAILVVRKTGSYQIVTGLVLLAAAYFFANLLGLKLLGSLLSGLKDMWLLALIVLFQPELRNIIARMGLDSSNWNPFIKTKKRNYDPFLKAISSLSFRKNGAIFVFERSQKLDKHIATGEIIDAEISTKLLLTIFNRNTILHDGAVVIRGNRIYAVKVVLPLSQNPQYVQKHGTRHLAAIGITEESDAFCLVVSEESGKISYASNGDIFTNRTMVEITQRLEAEHIG